MIGKNSYQKSIKGEALIKGVGIHTGEEAEVRLKPAPEGTGIVFRRTDLEGSPEIPALVDFVSCSHRRTALKKDGVGVMTVEHMMAALCGLEIDNIYIDIAGEELPASDGSSKIYAQKIREAGIKIQNSPRSFYEIKEPFVHSEGESVILALPYEKFSVGSALYYNQKFPAGQYVNVDVNEKNFLNEISGARTFCFEKDIESIRSQGLGLGGNKENTVIIGPENIKNTSLRFKDELTRHKILDLMGDLYLLGRPIKGRVIAVKPGHRANINFTRKLKKYFEKEKPGKKIIDSEGILKILPHRYPFLMVDRIIVGEDGNSATGYKNITVNEPFFKGHFPDRPLFPTSLIVEFMAQSSAVLFLDGKKSKNTLAYFMIIEDASFYSQLTPPETVRAEVELVQMRGSRGKVKGEAFSQNGEKAAEAKFMFALVEG